jgi:hypothetical protein
MSNEFYVKVTTYNKALLIIFTILLLGIVVSRIIYPVDLGIYESTLWPTAEIAIRGDNPYDYAFKEPYVMAPYGYFYYLVIGFGLLFGEQFVWGRLLSVLASVVIVFCLFNLSKKHRFDPVIASVFFLCSAAFLSSVGSQRPDLIAMACGLLGFVLLNKNIYLASLVCFSALFFKQTFILMPVFAGISLLADKRYRHATIFYALGGIFSISVVAYLGENYIWQHFTLMQNIPWDNQRAIELIIAVILSPGAIALFVIRPSKILYYLMPALSLAIYSGARGGSGLNYFLEASLLLAVLVGMRKSHLLLAIILIMGSLQMIRNIRGEYFRWKDLPYYLEIKMKYLEYRGGEGFSAYTDLIPPPRHFGDWMQYTDGRSPELKALFEREIGSKRYKAIIWYTKDDPLLTGYTLIPMESREPSRPVYLYVK